MGMGMRISVLGVDLGKNVCSLRFRAPKRKETPCRPISLWAISPIVGVAANWQGKVVDLSISPWTQATVFPQRRWATRTA
jgi:hypothetical protein